MKNKGESYKRFLPPFFFSQSCESTNNFKARPPFPIIELNPFTISSPPEKKKKRNASTSKNDQQTALKHALHKGVDLGAALPGVTALVEVKQLLPETTVGVGQLEGPQEVVRLLEVGADGVDLVDQVLDADDAELSEGALDHGVVRDGDALLVHLSEPALVDQLPDSLQVGVTVRHIGLDQAEHFDGCRVQLHVHRVVDLAKAKELQNLADLGGHADDTTDADHEHDVGLCGNMNVTRRLSLAAETDRVVLLGAVLLHVSLGAVEDLGLFGNRGLRIIEGVTSLGRRGVEGQCGQRGRS